MAPARRRRSRRRGPWHVTVGPTGPGEIRYNGQVLVQGVHLTGFQPQWKGSRFHMGGARITADKAGATWEKRDPGNQEATVAVSAAGPKLTFTLKTAIHAAGPTEWTFVLVPEAVRAAETHCSLRVDDKHSSLNLTDTFPQLSNFRELRFEQPERTTSSAPRAHCSRTGASRRGPSPRPGDWLRWEPGEVGDARRRD